MTGLKEGLQGWLGVTHLREQVKGINSELDDRPVTSDLTRIESELESQIEEVTDDVRTLEQAAENDDTADDLVKLEDRVDHLERETAVLRARVDLMLTYLRSNSVTLGEIKGLPLLVGGE